MRMQKLNVTETEINISLKDEQNIDSASLRFKKNCWLTSNNFLGWLFAI